MRDRLDALQNALSDLIEAGPTELDSVIQYYDLSRKFHVLEYYCKKEGYSQLGLHHIPASRVSEHNAKTAIQMGLVLRSLAKSAYASETWTLQDASSDLFASPPRNCFKKGGYEVTVWFDNDKDNIFPYTNWSEIYYQDDEEKWHKVPGQVDYDGLYYIETDGSKSYFLLFFEDAQRFSKTNTWTVHYKNETIYLPITSSSRRAGADAQERADTQPTNPTRDTASTSQTYRRTTQQSETSSPGPTKRHTALGRRRRGEGKSTTGSKRRRILPGGGSGSPAPEDVGSSHRSVARANLPRLARLQAEARDPKLILLRGPANTLKCWRYRCNTKCDSPICSTVFKWVSHDESLQQGRMLLAFSSDRERDTFIKQTHFPKGTTYSLGSLDAF